MNRSDIAQGGAEDGDRAREGRGRCATQGQESLAVTDSDAAKVRAHYSFRTEA